MKKRNPFQSLRAQTVATCVVLVMGTFLLTGVLVLAGEIKRGTEQLGYNLNLTADKKMLELDTSFTGVETAVIAAQDYILRTIDEERILRDAAYEQAFMDELSEEMTALASLASGVVTVWFRMNVERFGGTRGIFLEGSPAQGFIAIKPTDISAFAPTDTGHVGWYYEPIWAGHAIWTAPYENKNINAHLISYIIPIYRTDEHGADQFLGLVGMDLKLADIKNVVDSLPVENALCLLIGVAGEGFYQEEGKEPVIIKKGDVVHIPAGVRHIHGATEDSWFQQIVIYDKNWKGAETQGE